MTGPCRQRRSALPGILLVRFVRLAAIVLGSSPWVPGLAQEAPKPEAAVVERVDIRGNQFVASETFLHYISTRAGDRYDERRLREDFRRLWDTGFVDDLFIDVAEGPAGKVVRFILIERKRVAIIDYRGGTSLTTTAIEEELKNKDAAIKVNSFYDPGEARRVERIIKDMLAAKGRPFAEVRHETKGTGAAGVQLSFTVNEGSKVRVVGIDFTGNEWFSDGTLRRQMKKIKARGLWNLSWLLGKTTYTPAKWTDPLEGDRKRLEDFYLDRGYVSAVIGEPRLTYVDVKTGRKPVKGVRMEIPVTEGAQYRTGEIQFEGMQLFKAEAVRPLFGIKTGDVYRDKVFRRALDKLRDSYGAQGYFQWTARTERRPDPERGVVDVTVVMDEDKRYYVGKITFTGNTTTRDKVIRREVYLNEGDVFNTEALKLSIRRINQLGYFRPLETAPQLGPSVAGEDKLDVTLKVEEQNRNQFSLGGGVSGLEGTFVNAGFQTSNFLGLGETLQLSAQAGGRTNNYQVALTEPYLFDRPIGAGFDVYSRKVDYLASDGTLGYSEVRIGGSVTAGLPLRRFTRLFTNYTYEVIETAVRDDLPAGVGSALTLATDGRNQESRVSPSLVHDTVDSPYTPRSGRRLTGTLSVAGGPLGGTTDYWKPSLEAIVYVPHTRRTAVGFRGQVGWVGRYADTRELPYYQRYFLGGETQIRGVNVRTVSPLDSSKRAVGGNKFLLFNAEYYVDVAGPLRVLLFFDAGEAYSEGQGFNLRTLRTSTGAEMRFLMPVLNVPFRLIYAYNANRDSFQPRTAFKFAVGTTF